MAPPTSPGAPQGLASLRERAALPELLFLYECATLEPARLRTIAERLGLTVQAASHTFRALMRRGLVAVQDGRYRPTIEGVARLHGALDSLSSDVRSRIDRLHVIRSTRAVALGSPLARGDPVSLEIREGLLTARRARSGPSRGAVVRGGGIGALVEIGELAGIVPILPGEITVRTLSDSDLSDPGLLARVRAALPPPSDLLAADGLEAVHTLRTATDRPFARFAGAAACEEASRLGVASTLFVAERDLPRLLGSFAGPAPPKIKVLPVSSGRAAARPLRRASGSARRGARPPRPPAPRLRGAAGTPRPRARP